MPRHRRTKHPEYIQRAALQPEFPLDHLRRPRNRPRIARKAERARASFKHLPQACHVWDAGGWGMEGYLKNLEVQRRGRKPEAACRISEPALVWHSAISNACPPIFWFQLGKNVGLRT